VRPVVLLLLYGLIVPLADDPPSVKTTVRQALPAVVVIEVQTKDGLLPVRGAATVIDPCGYLVTAYHPVKNAVAVRCRWADGKEARAQVVACEPAFDLALLKVETKERLRCVRFAAQQPEVGEQVVAIGNPQGRGHTVTAGIVSALGRTIETKEGRSIKDAIQTDTAINLGNSGGPLLNLQGELIGVVLAIDERARGVGFALPSDIVQIVLSRHLPR
jgi:S1-C subfamily serine protease